LAGRCSSAQTRILRVVEGFAAHGRSAALAEHLDLQLRSRRSEVAANIGECNALVQSKAPATGGHKSDILASKQHRRAGGRIGVAFVVERKGHESLGGAALRLANERLPADKGGLL
jgi:hypothetical protein